MQGETKIGSRQNRYRDQYSNNIQIVHKCEGEKAKSVLRITVWQTVMPKGEKFLSYPHINNGILFQAQH